jgi:hypothetical protein
MRAVRGFAEAGGFGYDTAMNAQLDRWTCWLLVGALAAFGLGPAAGLAQESAGEVRARVLIVAGPSNHPPGTHEVAAGARVVEYCLEHAENVPGIEADVVDAWPGDRQSLKQVAAVVFTGDLFPPEQLPQRDRVMGDLSNMMNQGCGLVCIHYATGLGARHVAQDGDHPLLHWMGGYFATRCAHHQSIARVYPAAKIEPAAADHPALRGWKAFTLHDEPYINNYFGKQGLAKNVVPLATSMLPPEAPKREVVAWAVSRPDGGRGMGVVMPHFYRNWQVEDLRKLILNGIVWSARLDVPLQGVKTTLPELSQFEPAAIEPRPRAPQP